MLFNVDWSKRRLLRKLFLTMKLTAVIFLSACLSVSAAGLGQKVTLSEKNARLDSIFHLIEKQTGYSFYYKVELLANTKPVDIQVQDASLDETLQKLFTNEALVYTIVDRVIVVKEKSPSDPAGDVNQNVPPHEIRGHVTTAKGIPLAGANVIIKRTKKGTQTNVRGEFTLANVYPDDILTISFIGYKTQIVKVSGGVEFPIVMAEATDELDKVVVQAYGTTTQRFNTGNIGTVTAAEIERNPVMNPLEALQGRVPNVIVSTDNGYASAPVRVEIRGRSVIDGSQPSEPLYIVDGVPLTVLNLNGDSYASGSTGFTQGGLSGPAAGQSPFFSINPNDIESITVLKDADATAIYGSRGANGVIIVTTKSGKPGKAKFDLNVYHGASVATGRYGLLNTQQYLAMRREAFKNDQAVYGVVPGFTVPDAGNAYDMVVWDTTRYTDFQKLYWSGTGQITDLDMSLSGGDRQNTFRIGGSYVNQKEITSRGGGNQRGSVQFNYAHKSVDQRFAVSLTTMYTYVSVDLINVGGSVLEAPDAPAVFNSEGTLNWAGWAPNTGGLAPFANLYQPYNGKTGFLNSSLNVQYEILKGFTFSTRVGYSTSHLSNMYLTPIISQNPINANPTGTSQFSNSNSYNTVAEPQLEYKTLLGKGKLSILAGASRSAAYSDGSSSTGYGYQNDNLLRSLVNAPIKTASNGSAQYSYGGLFARFNYNLGDELIVNLSARRDGSTRFGPGKQYGNFWAVGAAWIFTEQAWFKNHLPVLSFGKLRASYGLTGNDQIANYGYLTQWSSVNGIPYQGTSGYVPLQHANPDLHWETNKKLEGALDLGFFRDRLTVELVWYQNRCGDQLVTFPLPMVTGFANVFSNSPALVQNTGHEMTLRARIIDHKNFTWSAYFNIGYNRNKLVSYPNFSQSPFVSTLQIGQSLSIRQLLHFTGVDPQTGQYTVQDKNHDGQITDYYNKGNNDFYVKDMAPPYSGGFGTDLRYKGLQLNLFFYFIKKLVYSGNLNGVPGNLEMNQSVDVLNRWQKPGDHAKFARFTTQNQASDSYFAESDGVYTDGSYLRLRNASLSYDFQAPWVKKAGMQQCMIYARGENLFTLTHFNGLDPAQPGLGAMPSAKTFTLGIQLVF